MCYCDRVPSASWTSGRQWPHIPWMALLSGTSALVASRTTRQQSATFHRTPSSKSQCQLKHQRVMLSSCVQTTTSFARFALHLPLWLVSRLWQNLGATLLHQLTSMHVEFVSSSWQQGCHRIAKPSSSTHTLHGCETTASLHCFRLGASPCTVRLWHCWRQLCSKTQLRGPPWRHAFRSLVSHHSAVKSFRHTPPQRSPHPSRQLRWQSPLQHIKHQR
mmetsp:Transcript_142966/g.356247  ORF Transcript_142966/g.356247 Transcript_142966/m.356247 type:complete len:218 (-) Transcript_142966:1709-2362(-)